jgi:hypothetical protein
LFLSAEEGRSPKISISWCYGLYFSLSLILSFSGDELSAVSLYDFTLTVRRIISNIKMYSDTTVEWLLRGLSGIAKKEVTFCINIHTWNRLGGKKRRGREKVACPWKCGQFWRINRANRLLPGHLTALHQNQLPPTKSSVTAVTKLATPCQLATLKRVAETPRQTAAEIWATRTELPGQTAGKSLTMVTATEMDGPAREAGDVSRQKAGKSLAMNKPARDAGDVPRQMTTAVTATEALNV